MSGFVSALSRVNSIAGAVRGVASTLSNLAGGLGGVGFGSSGAVVLGDFVFSGFEVPDQITIGGAQAMTVHKLPGGDRVVDLLGPDERDIEWSGTMIDDDPVSRAQQLDQMRVAGDTLPLTWGDYFYSVIIRSFEAQNLYSRVQYRIACVVLVNEAAAQAAADPTASDTAQSGISGALGSVSSAISQTASTIHQVIAPIGAVVNSVSNLAGAVGVQIPFLGQAQQALGIAGNFAGTLNNVAGVGYSLANTATALGAASASFGGGMLAAGVNIQSIVSNSAVGQLISGASDLQTAVYAAGMQASTAIGAAYSGAAAIIVGADAGQAPATTINDSSASSYQDPTPLTKVGAPGTSQTSLSAVINTSGDPTQGLWMSQTTTYDANGNPTVTYSSVPALPGGLTAADAKYA
jgi:hypothetical protein